MSRRAVIRLAGLGVVVVVAIVGVSVAFGAGQDRQSSAVRWSSVRWSALRRAHEAAGTYITGGVRGRIAAGKYGHVVLKCPTSHPHAIGGFFDSNGAVVLETNAPVASNKWNEGGLNIGRSSASVLLGVVCAR